MNVGKTFGAKAYTPGSIYQRSKQLGLINPNSTLKKANRRTVEKNAAAVLNSSATIFNALAEQSQGKSELVTQQLLLRVQEEAKAKSENLTGLGALMNEEV
jgi:hypothetical protein